MANKKDKKVKAGKVRASLSLRDNKGRFTTNIFKREVIKSILSRKIDVSKDQSNKDRQRIDQIIKEAKITQAELNREYKKNIEMFSSMLSDRYAETTFRNSNDIENDIENYKGKFQILRNGEKINVTKVEMKHEFKKLKQFFSTSLNAADFSQRVKLTFDGKMIISIPDIKELRKKYRDEIKEAKEQGGENMVELVETLQGEFENETQLYGS